MINIITRKDYRGTEVRFSYANTFRTDAAKRSVSLTHGFARGKLSGQVSVSYEDNTQLANRDVWFQKTGDRRAFGGPDLRSTTLTEGTGYVRTTTGANLPGLTSSRAAIPANSDGRTVTVADYANAGAIGAPFDAISYYVESRYRMKSGSANFQYRYRPWLTAFLEARASQNSYFGGATPSFFNVSSLTVPAGYPGNPFGVPVVAVKVFFDASPVSTLVRNETVLATGVKGSLPHDWRYELSLNVQRAHADQLYGNNTISGAAATAAVNGANPPILLYDSTRRTNPNPPGTLASLVAASVGSSRELPVSWLYEAVADGPLWQLPAGPVRLAAGAERREEYVDFVTLVASATLAGPQLAGANRTASSVFAEARVPLVSPRQSWPWLHAAEIAAAGRHDEYAGEGRSANPSLHAMVQPVSWLMLRADFSRGFKVADISSKYRPALPLTLNTTSPLRIDPRRGNQLVPAPYTQISVGNPNLKPEQSESQRYGVVVDVPFAKGLSLSAGWWGTDYTDRIVTVSTAYTFAEAVLALPNLFTRGPNLPGDPAGWPGPITSAAISSSINIGISRLEGWDASAKYDRATPWGNVTLRADFARTTRNELRPTPTAALSTSVNTDSLPLQATGSLFWNRGALDTGVLYTYRGPTRVTLTGTSTPSAVRWDWQGSCNFEQTRWLRAHDRGWLKAMLGGTRVSFTVFNVLDEDPPRDQQGYFDLSVIGSRLRHYSLQLTKSF